MDSVVRMLGVAKSYGAKIALEDFDLEIERGRVVGLLGLNGAGKSTAMRLMIGLLKPDAGAIRVLGENPWRMQPADRRRIGYLSEKDFPFPELDLEQAVAFVSRFHTKWDDAYLRQLLRILDVPTRTVYRSMSRGQQRKFHLALTLAPRPELLLLDDPGQGLDVAVRRELIQSVLPLLEEGGSTVVFSSHVFSDIERLADSVAIVHEGRVLLAADVDSLKERALQVVVPSRAPLTLRGIVRTLSSQHSTRVTLLDPDPREIENLRRMHPTLEERRISLEELFLELVEGSRIRRAS